MRGVAALALQGYLVLNQQKKQPAHQAAFTCGVASTLDTQPRGPFAPSAVPPTPTFLLLLASQLCKVHSVSADADGQVGVPGRGLGVGRGSGAGRQAVGAIAEESKVLQAASKGIILAQRPRHGDGASSHLCEATPYILPTNLALPPHSLLRVLHRILQHLARQHLLAQRAAAVERPTQAGIPAKKTGMACSAVQNTWACQKPQHARVSPSASKRNTCYRPGPRPRPLTLTLMWWPPFWK